MGFLTNARRGAMGSKTKWVFYRDLDWWPGPQKVQFWKINGYPEVAWLILALLIVYLWCLSLLSLYSYLLKLYIWVWLFDFVWGLFENCQKQICSRGWSGAPESFYCYNNCHFRKITRRSNNSKNNLLKSSFNFCKNGKDTFKNHESIQITTIETKVKGIWFIFGRLWKNKNDAIWRLLWQVSHFVHRVWTAWDQPTRC